MTSLWRAANIGRCLEPFARRVCIGLRHLYTGCCRIFIIKSFVRVPLRLAFVFMCVYIDAQLCVYECVYCTCADVFGTLCLGCAVFSVRIMHGLSLCRFYPQTLCRPNMPW